MTRLAVIFIGALFSLQAQAQSGDQQLRAKADALFEEQRFAEAFPLYSQLVSLEPSDRALNYRFGACMLFGSADKEQAIGHLKFATEDPTTDPKAWYWLGRAYHLNYRFKEAQVAYQRFLGTGDRKSIEAFPVEALMKQCRNGEKLLSSLKEITVRSKVEVVDAEFFRFYELADIGGRIVVLPEELRSSIDKKKKERQLVYLPAKGGPIYFSSYGREGGTGKDIYRTELLPDGTFSLPTKLAGYINSDQDEDYAFMHPDGKTFYFCSRGHNSMGGYDVFKATYDRGLDAFGRPENMDFAVNTPDDDVFYMVDAEHKEACFASGRNSHQGMLHVYRVATAQLPVVITVFKGTYASELDADDRKAHIVVEDALTNERVADVRTDVNGNYVLSVPRAGKYRYRVECGPTGKTHGGMVDVPTSDGPRAYRQELVLEPKGDLEQLTIRSYFDDPLSDDLIALSLDEIKRRARLDVTGDRPVAELPAEPAPTGDVITRAGFTGDVDETKAVQLAREDANELEAQSMSMQAQAEEAYAIAVEATNESERSATRAAELIAQAGGTTEETERNALMTDAARERQRAREATLRARAAMNTGDALSASALTARQRSVTASKLATDVIATLGSGNDEAALPHLRALKDRLDEKSRPDLAIEPAEAARRTLVDHEKEVQRAMSAANAKRTDENELTDRVLRLKREREETRARSRQGELDSEIAALEQQLGYLREETATAYNKVAGMEKQTAVLRGQASLTRHLTQATEHGPGTALTAQQAGQLTERISDADQQTAALAIDERYDAQLSIDPVSTEARTFDWDLVSAAQATGDQRDATRAVERIEGEITERADTRTTPIPQSEIGERSTTDVAVENVPVSNDGATEDNREAVAGEVTPATNTSGTRSMEESAPERDGSATEAVTTQEASTDRFLLENERAELQQLAEAERSRAKRDSIEAQIASIDQRLAQPVITTAPEPGVESMELSDADLFRPIVVFTEATKDEAIIEDLFADYDTDRANLERLTDADERASGLNGLELMLADSLRAEMQRQVTVLQLAPQQAEVVLPRVDRLRELRESHLQRGDSILDARKQEVAGSAPTATRENVGSERMSTRAADGSDPINDRFIVVDRYAQNVFASRIEHRSRAKGVEDAIAFKEVDVARINSLTTEIDSMEQVLSGMPLGKESDRLRRDIDMRIDERFIVQTDLGQRSAFLTKEEWRTANDSLDGVKARTAARGLAPNEPLLLMANEMQAEAKATFDAAARLRKQADRIEDIVARDSLYRRAYRTELEALIGMDRAITVQNYLAGSVHQRGEALSYEEVASRVLDIPLQPEPDVLIAEEGAVDPAHGVPDQMSGLVDPERGSTTETLSPEASSQVEVGQPSPELQTRMGTDQEAASMSEQATPPVLAPAAIGTDEDAQAMLRAIEERLANKERIPPQLYERFLASEPSTMSAAAADPTIDPDLLALRVERSTRTASELEQRSQEAADRATALADSATTAKKRDRQRLETMAVRERALSDSLHQASVLEVDAARATEALRQEAEVAKSFRDRLVKFYYLTPEEQQMVMLDGDASRFFQMRTRALEQYQAADDAAGAAKSNREVADALREQARAAASEAAVGSAPSADAAERAAILGARALALSQRADSLDNVAARLRGAAGINENQASVLLQGMPADRSSEMMALEMGKRRTESLLAEARDQAGRPAAGQPQVTGTTSRIEAGQQGSGDRSVAEEPAQPAPVRSEVDPAPTPMAFRMPERLTTDIFDLRAARTPRQAAIPMDEAMPAGIVFKVQIGAFRKPVPQQAFSDMSPVMGESVGNGLVRYTAGLFTGFDGAAAAKDQVRDRGYRDAFVVAYRDGKRIPLGEAMRATGATTQPTRTVAEERLVISDARTQTVVAERPVTIAPPVPTPIVVQGNDSANILASYPSSAAEIMDRFVPTEQAAAYYDVPGAAPAAQVETIRGLFFTVQVGVYSKPVPLEKIFNISPLNSERTETAKVRYTTGRFQSLEPARVRKDQAVALGVKDAYVTAYLNGKRIPVREAMVLLEKFGPSILAKP